MQLEILKPLKFVVTGPESSGKTTLAQSLGGRFGWPVVPEYARIYLEGKSMTSYNQHDFDRIVLGQFNAEQRAEANAQQPLIFDTSALVLHIWHLEKWGGVHPLVQTKLKAVQNTFFLLCRPDIPWQYDPLREHPEDRDHLYGKYFKELKNWNFPFIEICGSPSHRLEEATLQIKKWAKNID